jgi:hypothetical protein
MKLPACVCRDLSTVELEDIAKNVKKILRLIMFFVKLMFYLVAIWWFLHSR